jgi:NAD(P)H-dependent flavin oxidoreductase YrpB (nitropropane dioxygenase family)
MFGIEAPIIAFSHCRDVVVEASKAGGMGVLGAESFTPEELAIELEWIEEHIDGRPYGVDVLFPLKFEDISRQRYADPKSLLPQRHREFVERILHDHSVPHLPDGEEDAIARDRLQRGRATPLYSAQLLDVAFRSPGVKLIVSAIGTPPPEMVERAHAAGMKFGAMVGKVEHALRQRDAGVDVVIAQGYEAGGHTGEIATMVLTPEVVDAVAPLPVLAAGGIGRGRQVAAALALGAEGVWCGSVWLTTTQSDAIPELRRMLLAAKSSDTVRTRSYSGKPARYLRNSWTDAWDAPGAPEPLVRPLQHLLAWPAIRRIERARDGRLIGSPIGQVVGHMNQELTVRQVFYEMMSECADAVERINRVIA